MLIISTSTFTSASAFQPILHRSTIKMPKPEDLFAMETSHTGARQVQLASYAPSPYESDFSSEAAEFYSEFDDYEQFDDEDFPVHHSFPLEGDSAAWRMLQRQRNSRHERAERRARASARLAGRNMRSSPDALRLVAGAMSDFATSLGVGFFNAATPLLLDPISADSIRVAVYNAFNNATTDALGCAQPWSTAVNVNRQELTNFILRNAVVPAILHRVASIVADSVITDAKFAEKTILNDFTIIFTNIHVIWTDFAHAVASPCYDFQ